MGSALVLVSAEPLVDGMPGNARGFGLPQTFVGMTVLALVIGIEEMARELPAAPRGHPEISCGNVVGSVLAFLLFNAAVIALP